MPGGRDRFRWMLRLLPRPFREEYGSEILRAWNEDRRAARRSFWARALAQTLRAASRERAGACSRNVRFATRQLRRSPAFTLTAVLTLALGTGATAAVFGLVNAVLLRPLPWRAPDAIGVVWAVQPSGERTWLSFPELDALQRDAGRTVSIAGMTDLRLPFRADGVGQELQALAVGHGLFRLLGVSPSQGRDFARDDDREGAAPVAILSHAFWRTRFGADPSAVGRTLTLNDRDYSVIGILAPEFELLPASSVLPDHVDVWLPLEPHLASRNGSVRFLHALARLAPGVSFAQADAELRAYAERLPRDPEVVSPGGPPTLTIVSFTGDVLKNARGALYLLFGLVLLVLVMACANVAQLLLARGESRRTELAIRTALGAGPATVAGELLAEAFVLAACGSLLGCALAAATPAVIRSIDVGALPRLEGATAAVDGRTAAFMVGLVLLTLLVFASAPLIERLRPRNAITLIADRSGGRTRRSAALGKLLVTVQTALATTIIVTTIFLGQALLDLQRVELGFKADNALTARVTLSAKYPAGPAAARFFAEATAAIGNVPGVTGAAAITQLPLSGAMLGSTFLVGAEPDPRRIDADLRGITARYFDVIGTPLVAGRSFTPWDSAASPAVAIVDDAFARRMSPDGRVVGKRIRWFRQPDVEVEIVGVVRSVRHRGPGEPSRETVYRPHHQYSRSSMFVVARTNQSAAAATSNIRAAVATVDASQPFADVSTLEQRVARSVGRARTSVILASVLASLALALGAVGLYGVLSFGVAQRMREFGVRVALGARPAAVRVLVLREGLTLTVAGVALGIALSAAIVTVMRSTLYASSAQTLTPYALGMGVVLLCSSLAFWFPARKASAVDPIVMLRSD
jgi:putative ABC transport system permease protein